MIDLDFAKRYCDWRVLVRKLYPDKFYWVKEGNLVRDKDGRESRVTNVTYFPATDRYLIEVIKGDKQWYYTSPHELEVLNDAQ